MAKDCQGLTVHTLSPAYERGPVFYASLPCGGPQSGETSTDGGTNGAGDKHRLASALWDRLAATDSSLWKRRQSSDRAGSPIQLVRGPLGRPHLLWGEHRGPAISFSEGGGRVWAALCGDESDVGIDVAGADEFQGAYPSHRVFHTEELQHTLRLAAGDMARAFALLWSIKEAVVKAMGCAFHLVDPRHVTVYPRAGGAAGEEGGYAFSAGLSGKALVRFPSVARGSLRVRSFPQEKMWLSIALLNRQP